MYKFIVVIPVYNAEKYLKNCVKSVLEQTYQQFEIVLANDGSVDRSGDICDELQKSDYRIHVIHQENMGQLSARLAGLQFIIKNVPLANSFIVHLDSDDQFDTIAFERLNEIIKQSKCDTVIFTMKGIKNGMVIDDIGWTNIYEGLVIDKRELYSIILTDNKYNSLCCKAFSTDLIPYDIIGTMDDLYSVRHGEDLIQSLEFLKNSKRVMFVEDKLYIYTFNSSSISRVEKPINSIIDSKGQQYVWNFIREQNVWGEYEFSQYYAYCRELLCDKVKRIITRKSRNEMFFTLNSIRNDKYYRMLLISSNKSDILLRLLYENQVKLLIQVGRLGRVLIKMKHAFIKNKF